jgi:hypothetical protein
MTGLILCDVTGDHQEFFRHHVHIAPVNTMASHMPVHLQQSSSRTL